MINLLFLSCLYFFSLVFQQFSVIWIGIILFLFWLESVEFIGSLGWYVGFFKKSNLENYIFIILYHCVTQIYFIIPPHFLSSLFMTLIVYWTTCYCHWGSINIFQLSFSVFQFVVSTASFSSSLIFPSVVTTMLKIHPVNYSFWILYFPVLDFTLFYPIVSIYLLKSSTSSLVMSVFTFKFFFFNL